MSFQNNYPVILEACVETLKESIAAQINGAHRLELCADLANDGLTPNPDLINEVLHKVTIPVKIMIRCREGDFYYSEIEIKNMVECIREIKSSKVAGIVFGALKNKGTTTIVNTAQLSKISDAAYPLPVTLHKCIDLCTDIKGETSNVCKSGLIRSILSSGGEITAIKGLPVLNRMNDICREHGTELIAAGNITQENLGLLLSNSNLRSYHGRKIV